MTVQSGFTGTGCEALEGTSMSTRQWMAVCLCIGVTALDGFDALSISFAAPGLAEEWQVKPVALGIVLSMELIGMAVGSIALGAVADRHGRRPVLLGSLLVATIGMTAAVFAQRPLDMALFRLFTGLGIGGILATTVSIVSETSNLRARSVCVSLTAGAYPFGAFFGGMVAAQLAGIDWRAIFQFGAIVSAVSIPLAWLLIPESVPWLLRAQPGNALHRANGTLALFGKPLLQCLPTALHPAVKPGIARLFSADLRVVTGILTLAFLAHLATNYFLVKWTPAIVSGLGFGPSSAGSVLVWVSGGGIVGSLFFTVATQKWSVRSLLTVNLVIAAGCVAVFGFVPADLVSLSLVGACAGFGLSGGVVGFYNMFVEIFPPDARASGIGFVIGTGRMISSLSPIGAGALLEAGVRVSAITLILGSGSALAAILVALVLTRRTGLR